MKIVIPGGSGQVGTPLARHFVQKGHAVVILSRRFIRAFDSSVTRSEEDRTRAGQLDQQLRNQTKYTIDVLDSVPVALALRDAGGKYLFVNRQWEQWVEARDRPIAGPGMPSNTLTVTIAGTSGETIVPLVRRGAARLRIGSVLRCS